MRFCFLIFIIAAQFVHAGPEFIGFQGRLYDVNGDPLDNLTEVKLRLLSSTGCLLREESHQINFQGTSGYFSVSFGLGTLTAESPNFVVSSLFDNTLVFTDPNMNCAGNSYTPSSTDYRLLRVVVGGEELSPDQVIGAVPYASNSTTLGGLKKNDFIKVAPNLTQTSVQSFFDAASSLGVNQSLRWNAANQWEVFTPGAAGSGILSLTSGDGLTDSGTANDPILSLNIGSSLQFNSGALEVNQSSIDYGNLANTPTLPTAIDDLSGNSDNITQGAANLFMTTAERAKLAAVEAAAEVNVQSDWNATSGDAQILNKPIIPSNIVDLTVGNDSISGNTINGGIISSFASTGIDDNAATTAITIGSSGNVGVGATNPGSPLEVNGVIHSTTGGFRLPDGTVINDANDLGSAGGGSSVAGVKAFALFDGDSCCTLRKGSNVSSVVRNSAGDYTINFSTPMPDADYLVLATATRETTGKNNGGEMTVKPGTQTTTSVTIMSWRSTNSSGEEVNDVPGISVAIFDSGTGVTADTMVDADGDTRIQVEESSDEDMIRLDTAGSQRMVIDNLGNVGIGTPTPNAKLTIEGAMTFNQQTSDPTGTGGYGSVYAKTDGKLYFRDGTGAVTDLTGASGAGLSWSTVTSNTVMAANNGYFTNSVSRLEMTLPPTCIVGDVIKISGINSGGWKVLQQNSGHTIHGQPFGQTTVGSSGFVESQSQNGKDSIELTCATTNDVWSATSILGSAGYPASVVKTASSGSGADLTTYTFSSQSLGTTSSDRHIIVGIAGRSGSSRTISSVTVAGNAATEVVQYTSSGSTAGIYIVALSTGTTGDIVVTFSGSMVRAGIGLWAATGLQSSSATATDTGLTTLGPQVQAHGFNVLATYGTQSSAGCAWSNIDEDYNTYVNDGSNDLNSGFASREYTATTTPSYTADCGSNNASVSASFR